MPHFAREEAPHNTAGNALRVVRGVSVPIGAPISVIVMAINGDARAVDAVASLRAQDVVVQIIVVNTGHGSLAATLTLHLDHIVLAESDELRLPGGTRNLGISQSTSGIVAFLAADCVAAPGWASRRLAAHAAGALAVASALRPAPGKDGRVPLASWATYALLHPRRFPECPPDEVAAYGASYSRRLFELHGLFREDLRVGEDTEFRHRITSSGSAPEWAPEVVTLHNYPATLKEALIEMFERGRNLHSWQLGTVARPLRASLLRVASSWRIAQRLKRCTLGETRRALDRAALATLLLAFGYALGAIAAAVAHRQPDRPSNSV